MALMDAKPYDESRDKRKRAAALAVVLVLILLGITWYELRFWPEEHAVNKFFTALEHKDYEGAYGLWMADLQWKQHPQKYDRYSFGSFYQDWGPPGEYGAITSHKILGASNPDTGPGSGVVVTVQINGRPVSAKLWVEKRDKSLGFPP